MNGHAVSGRLRDVIDRPAGARRNPHYQIEITGRILVVHGGQRAARESAAHAPTFDNQSTPFAAAAPKLWQSTHITPLDNSSDETVANKTIHL